MLRHLRTVAKFAAEQRDPQAAALCDGLGDLLLRMDQHDEAQHAYERALALRESILGPDHPLIADTLDSLAMLRWRQQDYDAARALFLRVLAIHERRQNTRHTAWTLTLLGEASKRIDELQQKTGRGASDDRQ